jgi:hypothetical protein
MLETGLAVGGQNRVLGLDNSGSPGVFGPYTNGYTDNNNNPPNDHGVTVPNIPQTGWVHLSWSYDAGAGKFSFTVGTPTTAAKEYPINILGAGTPMMNFYPGIVTLGASQIFGTNGWTGVMDEVRIWSVAKTPTEIDQNMKVVLKGTEAGLVAYYRFDEGSGTFTDDVMKKASHRLTTCATKNMTTCNAVNQNPNMVNWVTSDLPGPFTCAP